MTRVVKVTDLRPGVRQRVMRIVTAVTHTQNQVQLEWDMGDKQTFAADASLEVEDA